MSTVRLTLVTKTSSQPDSAAAAPWSPTFASPFQRATKRNRMTASQAYVLAHKARGKLSSEANRPDHNLRLLVGHANLLDYLMYEISEAEEQEKRWFNASIDGNKENRPVVVSQPQTDRNKENNPELVRQENNRQPGAAVLQERHVQWAPSPVTDYIHDEEYSDSDSDSDGDYEEDEDEEDMEELALQRSPSHSGMPEIEATTPELEYSYHSDSDSDTSEDEAMPPSPPAPAPATFPEAWGAPKHPFYDAYLMPQRGPLEVY